MEAPSKAGSPALRNDPDSYSSHPPREPIDQLAEEFVARYRRGERPSVSEYVRKYPAFADQLQELIQALVLLEELAPGQGREAQPDQEVKAATTLERLGDFRIIREVGRGGMGIVYEAIQESLGRRVAVKVLPLNSLLAPNQLERFRREARAAAGLHHTNIVPVFAVNEVAGVHFYAMQFIQGQGLDQILTEVKRIRHTGTPGPALDCSTTDPDRPHDKGCASIEIARSMLTGQCSIRPNADHQTSPAAETRTPLSSKNFGPVQSSEARSELSCRAESDFYYFRSVARVALQVAEALAYAHGQGVLHRDIKPSNLLLDLEGNVWVTDFGLAKTDANDQLTHTGDVVGTLRYMAPERFNGWSDPRSDVYSLGLTLYEMVTLRPAYIESDHHRLLKRMSEETPPQPRRVDPHIPRDLETIVLKAMAREPAGRYQTCSEMAEDLRCFLAGRPIGARRTSRGEQFRLWCRRNPALAATCCLTLLTLLVGLVAFGWQWRRAEIQRVAAEANFQQAREAVDECFTTVTENAELQEPGLEAARRVLLQAALKYYQKFLDYQGDNRPVQADLARANYRVGYIVSRIGSPAEAVAPLQKAKALYSNLSEAGAERAQFQRLLSNCNLLLGVVYQTTGRMDAAEVEYLQAVNLCGQVVEEDPVDPGARHALASAQLNLGSIYRDTHRREQAVVLLSHALAIREALVQSHPQNAAYEHALALNYSTLAMVYYQTNRSKDAESLWLKGLNHHEHLVKEHATAADYQRELANSYNSLGALYFQTSADRKKIEEFYQKAVSIREQLVRDHPRFHGYQSDLARGLNNLALFYTLNGRLREAAESYGRALAVREELARKYPEVISHQAAVAKTHHDLGLLHKKNGHWGEAESAFRKSLGLQEQLCKEHPGDCEIAIERAISLMNLGNLAEARGKLVESLNYLEHASEIFRMILRTEPNPRDALNLGVQTRIQQASVLARMGRYVESLAIWQQLSGEKLTLAQQRLRAQSLPPAPRLW